MFDRRKRSFLLYIISTFYLKTIFKRFAKFFFLENIPFFFLPRFGTEVDRFRVANVFRLFFNIEDFFKAETVMITDKSYGFLFSFFLFHFQIFLKIFPRT